MVKLSKKNKEKCQIFTPLNIVNDMLDLCNYKQKLFGKKFLENSFGNGEILIEVVERYIKDCRHNSLTSLEIKQGLENDIYGIEIDTVLFNRVVERLNCITARENIYDVNWNLFNADALMWKSDVKFDYIVGNPPYLSYKELSGNIRKFLKSNFETCQKGKFDYYYAFIESSINLLSNSGKLVQLVPNSLYKNVFAQTLRERLYNGITKIIDYSGKSLFIGTTVSSTIFLYEKDGCKNQIVYFKPSNNFGFNIERRLLGNKWVFANKKESIIGKNLLRFGDFFHSAITVATLCNEIFVVNDATIKKYDIEKAVLKYAISPKLFGKEKNFKIIFPYFYNKKGELVRYSEKKFSHMFPNTLSYLKKHKVRLDKRTNDKSCQWFEYGRSQAIRYMHQEKLLLSTIITGNVKIQHLQINVIPYSGIYIRAIGKYPLDIAMYLLRRKEFYEYIKKCGVPASGDSVRITSRDINEWEFDKKWIVGKV